MPEVHGGVQGGLAAQRGQEGIRFFLLDDLANHRRRDGLDVGPVRELRIRHDGGRIRIHQDHLEALLAQRLARLRPRVIEFTTLADHNRPRSNQQNLVQALVLRHACPKLPFYCQGSGPWSSPVGKKVRAPFPGRAGPPTMRITFAGRSDRREGSVAGPTPACSPPRTRCPAWRTHPGVRFTLPAGGMFGVRLPSGLSAPAVQSCQSKTGIPTRGHCTQRPPRRGPAPATCFPQRRRRRLMARPPRPRMARRVVVGSGTPAGMASPLFWMAQL